MKYCGSYRSEAISNAYASVRRLVYAEPCRRPPSVLYRRAWRTRAAADCVTIVQQLSLQLSLAKDSGTGMLRQSKPCCDCHEVKPLDAFHYCEDAPDKRQYRCIPCRKEYDRNRRRERRVSIAAAFRRWICVTVQESPMSEASSR